MIFKKRSDGGPNSGVTGYWVVEIKYLFSIVLLRFQPNARENFHSHAFNALTIWLKGRITEERIDLESKEITHTTYRAGSCKLTPRSNVHKVHCTKDAWALCFRGPWHAQWLEYHKETDTITNLTHGRKEL